MEEERQRQAAATSAGGPSTGAAVNPASPAAATYSSTNPQVDEFDAELRAALLASMEEVGQGLPTSTSGDVEMDEELRKALAESMEDWDTGASGDDSALIAELVATLPGVDVNDPRFQEALRHLKEQRGKK
jgi:26S proteasome regulatory subunit N10